MTEAREEGWALAGRAGERVGHKGEREEEEEERKGPVRAVAEGNEPEGEGLEEGEERAKGIEEGEAGLVEIVCLLDEERGLGQSDGFRYLAREELGGHDEIVRSLVCFSSSLFLMSAPPSSIPQGPYALMLKWFASQEKSVRLRVQGGAGEGSKGGGAGGGGGGGGLREAREALVRRVRGSL